MSRGLVIGCGGTIGAAWAVGALVAVQDLLGWDARDADVLVGTSAGAEFVTLLGGGVSVRDILAAQLGSPEAQPELVEHLAAAPGRLPPLPRPAFGRVRAARVSPLAGLLPRGTGDATWLTRLASRYAADGWLPHPAAWIVAADCDTGERVAFGSPGAPEASLADAVRASWAIPGWFPPVSIGGRRYADGGVASPTSADLVLPLGLDEVVVLAPMASTHPGRRTGLGRVEQWLRTRMTRILDAELAQLRAAGVKVLRIEPGPEDLAAMGPNFMDGRRRLRTLETSLRTSVSTLDRQLGVR
jgi:NTE family protein